MKKHGKKAGLKLKGDAHSSHKMPGGKPGGKKMK